MALLVRRCPSCGHKFEVLTAVRHSLECEKCGSETVNVPTLPAYRVYTSVKSPREQKLIDQARLRQKQMYDKRSDDIRSGALEVELRGPKEFWPEACKEKRVY